MAPRVSAHIPQSILQSKVGMLLLVITVNFVSAWSYQVFWNEVVLNIWQLFTTEDVLNTKIDLFISVGCTHIICGSHPAGSSYTYLEDVARANNVKLTQVTKIGCKGDKADCKYTKICDYADRLAVDEILLYI